MIHQVNLSSARALDFIVCIANIFTKYKSTEAQPRLLRYLLQDTLNESQTEYLISKHKCKSLATNPNDCNVARLLLGGTKNTSWVWLEFGRKSAINILPFIHIMCMQIKYIPSETELHIWVLLCKISTTNTSKQAVKTNPLTHHTVLTSVMTKKWLLWLQWLAVYICSLQTLDSYQVNKLFWGYTYSSVTESLLKKFHCLSSGELWIKASWSLASRFRGMHW